MKKLVTLLLCLGAFEGHAQAPATASRADSAIHLNVVPNGRYARVFYTINQEPVTAATVKRLLGRYPPAGAELRKGRVQTRFMLFGLLPVFAGAIIVGGLQADQHRNEPGSNFSKAPVPFSISLAALFGTFYLGGSNTHLEKAIEAYNQRFK